MSFGDILSTLLLGPLKLIFEFIFFFANKLTGHPGLSIIALSMMVNLLLMPLYKRADAMQKEARDTEAKLHDTAEHIKKTFSGDERMMILQTFYRQNNYKPTDALNGSVSLLLQIPFFMAAYQYLSGLVLLEGVHFGPIGDLSLPDALFVIGGFTVNVLPILMTLVNFVSSAIYLKGFPVKTKIQMYAMAVFFLVFLYDSPSGLVLYWTMNNLFSLGKTLFYKLKNPWKVIAIGTSGLGLCLAGFTIGFYSGSVKVKAFLLGVSLLLQIPAVLCVAGNRMKLPRVNAKPDRKQFVAGCLLMTVLTGLLIPSTFIAASPQEYVDLTYYHNPLWYCVSASCLAAGMFLVWMGVFYWLSSDKAKAVFDKAVWILSGVMLMNYMFFGTDLGIISASLQYENGMVFTGAEQLLNLLAIVTLAVCLYLAAVKWKKAVAATLLMVAIALGGMSGLNVVKINQSLRNLEHMKKNTAAQNGEIPHFELSKDGKNVVVILLDRGMGEYIPYLFQEKPELKEQFDGFTYYSNTIAFGGITGLGAPALMGGYEYTPVEMNKRSSELMVDKHNEALKMMPVLFWEEGYEVTVCDPPYANYQWIPDLSIYDDYAEINTYLTTGIFTSAEEKAAVVENNRRNFFCFSVMKTMPLVVQPTLYNGGRYNNTDLKKSSHEEIEQVQHGLSVAEGLEQSYVEPYAVLENLSAMSRVTEERKNTFLFLYNSTTHGPTLLQTPDYVTAIDVDNRKYDATNADRFTVNGRTLHVETEQQMAHYHANMGAMLQLGRWMDELKENGVYDNTRIILVADHGYPLGGHKELDAAENVGNVTNVDVFFPLLMVKDFGSAGFTESDEFMTHADVPFLAVNDLIENPVNPFTGKPISNEEKTAHDQMIATSRDLSPEANEGKYVLPSYWATVKDNIWDKENWSFSDEKAVLAEHKLP